MVEKTVQESSLAAQARDRFWIPRLFIALVLLVAAGLKIHQLSTGPVEGTGLFANRWVNLAEADCEIVLAFWLLSGWARRMAWAASLLLFATFSAITATKFLAGEASCGCFGRVTVPTQYTFLLDVSIVVMLLFLRPRGGTWWPFSQWRRFLIAGAIAIPAIVVAAVPVLRFTPARLTAAGAVEGEDRTVLLEPETWVGQRLPLANHTDIAEDLGRGDWLVALVHEGCAGCMALVPELAAKARAVGPGRVAKIALIHMPPHKESSELVLKDGLFLNGRLDGSRDWLAQTPTVLRLKDGAVTDVVIAQGDTNRKKVLDAELPVVQAGEGEQTIDASPGSTHTALFAVRNPSAKALTISGAKSESGCLEVKDCPKRVPPYSFALVSVTFVAPREPSPGWSGRIILQPEGPDRPAVPLTLRANVH